MLNKILFLLTLVILAELAGLLIMRGARQPWTAQAKTEMLEAAELPEAVKLTLPTNPKATAQLVLDLPERSVTLLPQNIPTEAALGQFLLGLAAKENRPAQDAVLEIENDRATAFAPDEAGQALDLAESRRQIIAALINQQPEVVLPVVLDSPKIKLSETNALGIRELVARGQSDFSGSPRNRIHNIRVGAARFHGVIVQPDEEFSFTKYLGPVDGEHGFLPELVIKPEGTVPEFGGGLCQVSTTAFRAAFFGGLPIMARRNHSYAVKYYEWIADGVPRSVGLDATIYPGAQDMKFLNDTEAPLLIATKIEGTRLYFEFYGTQDGRVVEVDGPQAYDRKPSGAVKATVARKIFKNGELAEERTFLSNYVSPSLYPHVYEFPPPAGGPLPPP